MELKSYWTQYNTKWKSKLFISLEIVTTIKEKKDKEDLKNQAWELTIFLSKSSN